MSTVAIVGAGAIGAWIADALAGANHPIAVAARGATLEALRTRGLRVQGVSGVRLSHPRAGSPAELGVHDFVILCVKAHHLSAMAESLRPLIGPHTRIVSATNGIPWWFFEDFGGALRNCSLQSVDPLASQAHVFPRGAALGAVVHAAARAHGPADVIVSAADRLILGEPAGCDGGAVEALAMMLSQGGIRCEVSPRIRLDLWSKLWGNMSINPLSALTRSTTARLFASAEVRELCVRMMQEMQGVGERLELRIDMSPEERIAIAERLGDFKTSMLVDLEAQRRLELSPQLGAVVEIAQKLGVPTPLLSTVLALASLL
jgi:2-dehydropantoate 2-reductase